MATTVPTTAVPDWASDATFTTGIETGVATTLTPSAAEIAQGVRAGRWVARKANWFFRTVTTWLAHLRDTRPDFYNGGTWQQNANLFIEAIGAARNLVLSGYTGSTFTCERRAYLQGSYTEIGNGSSGAVLLNSPTTFSQAAPVIRWAQNSAPAYWGGDADVSVGSLGTPATALTTDTYMFTATAAARNLFIFLDPVPSDLRFRVMQKGAQQVYVYVNETERGVVEPNTNMEFFYTSAGGGQWATRTF
jgi:hypothetical protein